MSPLISEELMRLYDRDQSTMPDVVITSKLSNIVVVKILVITRVMVEA